MEPIAETGLEMPRASLQKLSEAAVANKWTMKAEVIARLAVSLDRVDLETDQHQKLSLIQAEAPTSLVECALPAGVSGRYITIQSNLTFLRMYGFEVMGR